MVKKPEHLFFDLDHTLWDFETNSRLALADIYVLFGLEGRGIAEVAHFKTVYRGINEMLWKAYRMGNIRKNELRVLRFAKTLEHFGVRDLVLAEKIGDAYVEISPQKTTLMPNTLDVLDHLAGKYRMHIITNGFEEVQHIKLERSGLAGYFTEVITSEMASARKPDPEVFHLAMAMAGANAAASMMIGDDIEADVLGARNVGMHHVYYNPGQKPHEHALPFEIKDLDELRNLL